MIFISHIVLQAGSHNMTGMDGKDGMDGMGGMDMMVRCPFLTAIHCTIYNT